MAQQELKVIADFYDFMLWLIQRAEKFPRHHRYGLGLARDRISPQITQITQIRETGLGHMTCRANGRDWSGRHSICENLRNLRTRKRIRG